MPSAATSNTPYYIPVVRHCIVTPSTKMNLVNTRKAIYLYCLVVILLTIGCSYPAVTVVIDKKDLSNGKITIDDTMHCLFSDSLIRVQLIPGRHIIRYGNNEQKDFFVRTNGGLLNLDNQEYVAYEVEYQDKESKISFSMNAMTGKATILIDSFIISQKTGISFTSDSMLNTIVPILLKSKNGNYLFQIKNNENGYDTSESVFGLKKFVIFNYQH